MIMQMTSFGYLRSKNRNLAYVVINCPSRFVSCCDLLTLQNFFLIYLVDSGIPYGVIDNKCVQPHIVFGNVEIRFHWYLLID